MIRGERSAVAELYDRYARALYSLARALLRNRQEAEDLIHDVFLEAWRRAQDYDEARGTVRAWLLTRARSRALDRLKVTGRAQLVDLDSQRDSATAIGVSDPHGLHELLSRMPEPRRQVLLLGYFEGLSTAEIAARLDIPVGTVKSRTRAALGALRILLNECDG